MVAVLGQTVLETGPAITVGGAAVAFSSSLIQLGSSIPSVITLLLNRHHRSQLLALQAAWPFRGYSKVKRQFGRQSVWVIFQPLSRRSLIGRKASLIPEAPLNPTIPPQLHTLTISPTLTFTRSTLNPNPRPLTPTHQQLCRPPPPTPRNTPPSSTPNASSSSAAPPASATASPKPA